MSETIKDLVYRIAPRYNLPTDIVLCVILQESSGETYATRFEEVLYFKLKDKDRRDLAGWVPAPRTTPTLATEKTLRAHSWGLMQVLGETARWCAKYTGPWLTELAYPEVGIEVGCKVLSFYLNKANGDMPRALDMYNGCQDGSYSRSVLRRLHSGEHLLWFK